jgi:hypothetical protein
MKSVKLQNQLRKEGAGEFESRDLARLADKLEGLKFKGLSRDARDEIARIPDGKRHFYLPARWAMAGGLAVAVVLVIGVAQTSKPGSALYSVKRGAEKARSIVQPSYTETIVENRKEEVQELQKEAAPEDKVKKAEDALKKAEEKANQRKQKNSVPSSSKNSDQQSKSRKLQNRSQNKNWDDWRSQGSSSNSDRNDGSTNKDKDSSRSDNGR